MGAAVLGAAPHVLHHAGPLAGAALLAGVSGKLLFGALALMAPSSRPSSFVIGPALTDSGGGSTTTPPRTSVPSAPAGVSPSEHEAHHR